MTIDWNKPVQTRNGREVNIFTTNASGERPVVGEAQEVYGGWEVFTWSDDGSFLPGSISDLDLVNGPEEEWERYDEVSGEWRSIKGPRIVEYEGLKAPTIYEGVVSGNFYRRKVN